MDKDTKRIVYFLEKEIERVEYHMYNVLGLDREKVEELYRILEIKLEEKIAEQFENLVEVRHVIE